MVSYIDCVYQIDQIINNVIVFNKQTNEMVSYIDCVYQIDQMLQLYRNFGNIQGPAPATEESIRGIPTTKITQQHVG